jgi:hypothetical protein
MARMRGSCTRSFVAATLAVACLHLTRTARAETPEAPETPEVPRAPDAPDASEAPEPPQPLLVRVHMTSIDRKAILFMEPTPEERARLSPKYRARGVPICRQPCDRVLDASRSYFVWRNGNDWSRSEPIRLDGAGYGAGRVSLRVGRGSERDAALALVSIGAVTLAAGLVTMAVSWDESISVGLREYFNRGPNPRLESEATTANRTLWAGGSVTVIGLGMFIGGFVTLAHSKLEVEVLPGRATMSLKRDGLVLRF